MAVSYFPVCVPVLVIRLAELKAKPDANHPNAHLDASLLVSLLKPALRPGFPRRTGFKPDTSRTNIARTIITGFAFIMTAIRVVGNV